MGINELTLNGAAANLPPSSLPSIAITGQVAETAVVHWQLIDDKIEDKEIQEMMITLEQDLNSYADILIGLSGSFKPKWYNPISWAYGGLSAGCLNTAAELNEGANWISSSESGWLEIIGVGGGGEWITETQIIPPFNEPCMGDGECPSGYECIDQECVKIDGDVCDDKSESIITTKYWVAYPEKPNDGVVLVESQLLPGSSSPPYSVNNVTHFGETGSVVVHSRINNIFISGGVNQIFRVNNCSF